MIDKLTQTDFELLGMVETKNYEPVFLKNSYKVGKLGFYKAWKKRFEYSYKKLLKRGFIIENSGLTRGIAENLELTDTGKDMLTFYKESK